MSKAVYHLAKRRRLITAKNISLCFPELNPQEQQQLLKQTLFENCMGIIETGIAFWSSSKRLRGIAQFKGMDALRDQIAQGKGIILIGAHYTTLDLGGRLFAEFCPVTVMYRPHNNPLFDFFLKRSRNIWADACIARHKMRPIVRSLRNGRVLWFPADQDYGPDNAIFAPFFNITAATINTPERLRAMSNSALFVLGHHRGGDGLQYEITVKQIPEDQLTSPTAIATGINKALEKQIRRYPAQYMWVHRRFKTRPNGEASYYD